MDFPLDSTALASPAISPTQARSDYGAASHIGKRLRTGCHSCRLRKKRCDEGKPTCANCNRLGIDCLGYGVKRPEWLKTKKDVQRTTAELKDQLNHGRNKRSRHSTSPRQLSSEEGASGPSLVDSIDPSLLPEPLEMLSDTMPPPIEQSSITNELGLTITERPSYGDDFDQPTAISDLFGSTKTNAFTAGTNLPLERDLDEIWKVLFGNDNPFSIPASLPPPPPESQGQDNSPNRYLHHYLNVVFPMQFHQKSSKISDLVAPLALTHPDVLDAVSSLAALHMGAQRTRQLCAPADTDVIFAQAAHRKTIDRLRLIPVEEFPTEQVVILAIFATSFQLFSGGTAKMWRETIAVCQRCLSIMLSRSQDGYETNLKHYPELMPHLIWVDVVSSVSKNTGSRLLETYRKLLLHRPISQEHPTDQVLLEKTMGCDSTTTLALAEIVALSDWKSKAFDAGCLAARDLLERARPIEQLLEEREWRESHLQALELRERLYSDCFFYAAQILLTSTVDGPYPSLPDISLPVQKMRDTLQRLDNITQDINLARGLVLPITVAGCHANTASEQDFFRERFARLSPEAAAFGNTHSAMELMEEVWRRRSLARKSDRIAWTEVMMDMGWEAGILLI